MNNNQILNEVILRNGIEYQTLKLAEECGELVKACSKMIKDPSQKNRENIVEEMADALIMIDQMKYFYEIKSDELEQEMSLKMLRLKRRLEESCDGDRSPEKS